MTILFERALLLMVLATNCTLYTVQDGYINTISSSIAKTNMKDLSYCRPSVAYDTQICHSHVPFNRVWHSVS